MKKVMAILLCLCMVLCGFTACSKPEESTGDIENNAKITVWDDDRSASYMPHLINAFKKEYKDFNVNVVYAIKDAGNTIDDLATAGPAGSGADVIAFNHDKLGMATKQNLLFKNDKYKDITLSTQAPDALAACKMGDDLYGYPISASAPVMYYNKKAFAGKEDSLKTFDALKTFSAERIAATPSGQPIKNYGFMFNNGWGNAFWMYGLFAGYGGYAFGKDGTDPSDLGLNNAGAIAAAQYYQSWATHQAPGIDGDGTQVSSMIGLFKTGNIAAFLAEPADYASITNNLDATHAIKKEDVGVAKIPSLPGQKEMKPLVTIKMYGVSAYTKYPKAARAFAEFSQREEMQLMRFVANGTLPTNIEARKDEGVNSDLTAKMSMLQLPNCTVTPSIAEFGASYWGAMTPALNALFSNPTAEAKPIMDKCVSDMRTAINNMT